MKKIIRKKLRNTLWQKKISKISLVRFATHLKDIKKTIPRMIYMKKLGYKVAQI